MHAVYSKGVTVGNGGSGSASPLQEIKDMVHVRQSRGLMLIADLIFT